MRNFFEILFKTSKPIKMDNFNGLVGNTNDIIDGFIAAGYYKYQDCCGIVHFQSKPFTKLQIKRIEKTAKITLNKLTTEISHEINKQILKDIKEKENFLKDD